MRSSYLRRSLPAKRTQPITEDSLLAIRGETTNINHQITIYKSKILSTKDRIQSRDNAIKRVFKQSKKEQKLSTASKSQLKYFQEQIDSLQNTKKEKQKEYQDLIKSDRYWVANEVRSEIRTLYQENIRLNTETSNQIKDKEVHLNKIQELKKEIKTAREQLYDLPIIEQDIKDSNLKYVTYLRSTERNEEINLLRKVSDDFSQYQPSKDAITQKIEDLKKQYEEKKNETETINNDAKTFVTELDDIIEESLKKVKEAWREKMKEKRRIEKEKEKQYSTKKK